MLFVTRGHYNQSELNGNIDYELISSEFCAKILKKHCCKHGNCKKKVFSETVLKNDIKTL